MPTASEEACPSRSSRYSWFYQAKSIGVMAGRSLVTPGHYTTPPSSMIPGHAFPHHLFVDDSQLYVSFASVNSAATLNGLQSSLASVQV